MICVKINFLLKKKTLESEPHAEKEPTVEGEPIAEKEPTAEGEPHAEKEPTAEGEPHAEGEPTAEGEPHAEGEPNAETEPISTATYTPHEYAPKHDFNPMDCTDIIIGTARNQTSRILDYYTRDR